MSKRIYKYTIEHQRYLTGDTVRQVMLPTRRRVLHAGLQDGWLCVWAEVLVPQGEESEHTFHIVGTGFEVPTRGDYLNTVFDRPFVWHVYMELQL